MGMPLETDPLGQEIYWAGERVPPGQYRQVDGPRVITLLREDFLPASLDGKVAYYVQERIWYEIREPSRSEVATGNGLTR